MPLSYRNAMLTANGNPDPVLVTALQSDLRSLGYLRQGIDGRFGNATSRAIRYLQFDLLNNDRQSTGDGPAPISIMNYNRVVTSVTAIVDTATADSIEALLQDPSVPRLPDSIDPAAASRSAIRAVAAMSAPARAPAI